MTLKREKTSQDSDDYVEITNPGGQHEVVLACEHASAFIPAQFDDLGLSREARFSHIAWDPGALLIAQHLSRLLDATLVHSGVSRLVYDCNRPPSSPSAMPEKSEVHEVPGNRHLTDDDRAFRINRYYAPFKEALAQTLEHRQSPPVLVTIHSFTPQYHGRLRDVEIGILHDADTRLADALLDVADRHVVRRNEPYGPDDGVTHTLQLHAIPSNYLNVMIEIRNDLLTTHDKCEAIAQSLATWLEKALKKINTTFGADAGSVPKERAQR